MLVSRAMLLFSFLPGFGTNVNDQYLINIKCSTGNNS